jgi:hypothetical protein
MALENLFAGELRAVAGIADVAAETAAAKDI